ncbi:hypothetical protein OL239_07270 [Arthrobacter sp. ATA002]|uniref:hypothetical protein n=1 Tax=Arthrobacter sp. ATA002 TaxID=2991715 RepID=UPI0022A6E954|nr:hypothetical protein [Arthrobacter sp. ATA002]WAP52925.1 hypothetical protein OL239_07270 [Arthrobacter sp. ATA002]
MPRGTAARELSEPLDVGGHRFAVELVPAGGGAGTAVSVRAVETGVDTGGETAAETAPGSVLLRNALIERADLVRDDAPDAGERHLLQYLPAGAPEEHSRAALAEARRRLSGLLAPASAVASGTREVPDGGVNLLWWDERANFGDAVGPWLVRSLTGLTPVNGWRRNLSVPPLVTVGSTAGWLEQDGTRIWGAGLMTPLSSGTVTRLAGLRGIRIDAVRGELTANELRSRLSWTVPEVYGDPALLLPRFLPVPDGQPSQGRVAVLPHVDHQGLFGPRGTFDEPSASANSSTSGKASASGEAGETSEGRGAGVCTSLMPGRGWSRWSGRLQLPASVFPVRCTGLSWRRPTECRGSGCGSRTP